MPLTVDEVRVGKCADALLAQAEAGAVITVSDLAGFILEVGSPIVPSGDSDLPAADLPVADKSELVHTADVLHAHLDSMRNDGGRYHTGLLEDPTLTAEGLVQLLQMGNHAVAVAVLNNNGERFRRSLDEVLGK